MELADTQKNIKDCNSNNMFKIETKQLYTDIRKKAKDIDIFLNDINIPFDLILLVASYLKIPLLDKIKKIYYDLDDIEYIFKELKNENISDTDIGDNYICYNQIGEYGNDIKICNLDGSCVYELFAGIIDSTNNIYITTFYNNITQKGISEKFFSNRTEHYIDNIYHSTNFKDDIMEIIKANTKMIMCDKKYPKLYEFITSILESSINDITLIPTSEFLV
jgi:hypothetical protein